MRIGCVSLVLLTVVGGCSSTKVVPTDVAIPGMPDPNKALMESVAQVNRAMNQVDRSDTHRPTTEGPYIPEELQRPITFAMAGSLDNATKYMADHLGYRFASNFGPNIPPVMVKVDAQSRPMVEILRDLGTQAGAHADVQVDADHRTLRIVYHA